MALRACSRNGSGSSRWQRSMDAQDFGFSSLMDCGDVAPADELFFKGQLLPLLKDPRTHLVQSLCSSSSRHGDDQASAGRLQCHRLSAHSRGLIDGAVRLDSCTLQQTASRQHQTPVNDLLFKRRNCLQNCRESSDFVEGSGNLAAFSLGAAAMDCCTAATTSRSVQGIRKHGLLLWDADEELNTCRHELAIAGCRARNGSDALTASSFRSQSSAFWDSGTDKDHMDSNSSRDSNGSSQDSYSHQNLSSGSKAIRGSLPDHPRRASMASFSILYWKSGLLKRSECRKQADSSASSTVSHDSGNHKTCSTAPSPEAEAALLQPWKLRTERYSLRRRQTKPRARMSSPSGIGDKSEVRTIKTGRNTVQQASAKDLLLCRGEAMELKRCRVSAGGAAGVGGVKDGETRNQSSEAAAKRRWRICVRSLKPWLEMKGWMAQLGIMDDCLKKAYSEVEHGIVLLQSSSSLNPASDGQLIIQRRLSHQRICVSSALNDHNYALPQPKQSTREPLKLLAMSSCPASAMSSPVRNGAVDILNPIQQITNSLRLTNNSAKTLQSNPYKSHASANAIKGSIQSAGWSNSYSSTSSMQELHGALQSAIAHCKDSNKEGLIG